MELYDIFVLVVAAVVFYFLYRILSPVIRGLISMFKAGKRMVDRHNAKKAAQNAPEEADSAEDDGEIELGVVYEDPDAVADVVNNPELAQSIARLIIDNTERLWDYLSAHFDTNGKRAHKDMVAMALLLQFSEEYCLADNEEAIRTLNRTICAQDERYKENLLNLVWPGVWKVYMQYKPDEDELGKGAAMTMVRVLTTVTGPGIHEELYEFAGTLMRDMIAECDEIW